MATMFQSNSRNTIVLNGTNNFSSLRVEDPKKENDSCMKVMTSRIPQVTQYFNIVGKLGEGTFSKVYKARLKRQYLTDEMDESEEYALKYIIPIVKPGRVAKELRYLRDLGGNANIIPIKTCFYKNGHVVIVMPIVEHDRFTDYFKSMSIEEVRDYMRKLMVAMERVHSHGIIHRDIKPSNFLYNRHTGQCALVDFGLSQSERELHHTINMAMFPNKTAAKSNDSKVRKNLDTKFYAPNSHEKDLQRQKRTYNDMNHQERADFVTKRFKSSSIFISPITPSINNNSTQSQAKSNEIMAPETPVKIRQPLAEDKANTLPLTPVKNNFAFETPTKTKPLFNANKTPVKCPMTVPETPPKTVQKTLHFSRNIPSTINATCSKENVNGYSTPKVSWPNFQRFQLTNKMLHPELSAMTAGGGTEPRPSLSNRTTNETNNTNQPVPCQCIEKPCIVDCLSKPELNVPRAGTPGFRAPEILMRCQSQSTKIDIWSCGVIFACLLSGRYPFFRCADDMTCLAEIITVIGLQKVKKAAAEMGKTLVTSRKNISVLDLKAICIKLKSSSTKTTTGTGFQEAPDEAYDLLKKLLDPNPFSRISAAEALKHPFFVQSPPPSSDKSNQS